MVFGLWDSNWRWLATRLDAIDRKLNNLQMQMTTLSALQQREVKTMSAMDDAIDNLTTVVNGDTDVKLSAVKALQHLADLIEGQAQNPEAVVALAAKIRASTESLGAAIANTSGAAAPIPQPQPEPQPEPSPEPAA
jgi:cysteinyl-tRNA synthetase